MSSASVDFMRSPAPPPLGWWLLAAGIAAMFVALVLQGQWASDQMQAQRLERLRSGTLHVKDRPARPAEPTLAQRRWAQAQPELLRPWLPMLRAVETATSSPVYLLSLTLEPESGVLRLDAEAPDFGSAIAYVQRLDATGALLPGALLSHEEISIPGSPGSMVRFSATTRWNTQ